MKYFKYNLTTLNKITSLLKSTEFLVFGGGAVMLSGAFSLVTPVTTICLAGGVAATSFCSSLLNKGVQWIIERKNKVRESIEEKRKLSIKEFTEEMKVFLMNCTEKSIKDSIEQINVDKLTATFLFLAGHISERKKENSDSVSNAIRNHIPNIKPLVQYYNLRLMQDANKSLEKNKIIDEFATTIAMDLSDKLTDKLIDDLMNEPTDNCFERGLKRIMFI